MGPLKRVAAVVVPVHVENDVNLAMLGDTDWVPDIVIADQHLDGGDLGTATIAA